jgi:hypothetical protein
MGIKLGHASWTYTKNMQQGHAWTCKDRDEYAWTWIGIGMHGHAANMQKDHSWTCSMNRGAPCLEGGSVVERRTGRGWSGSHIMSWLTVIFFGFIIAQITPFFH